MYLTFRFEYFEQSNNVRKSRKNFPCGQLAHDTIYNTRFKYRVGLKSPKSFHAFLKKNRSSISFKTYQNNDDVDNLLLILE